MPRKYLIACSITSILTILAGIILIVIASKFAADFGYLYKTWTQIFTLSIFSIINGILATLFANGLLYVINRQFPTLTTLFSFLLIVVMFLSAICGIILLTGRSNLRISSFKKTQALFDKYSDSGSIQNSQSNFQLIQQSFQCCGVEAAADWKSKISDGESTPDSCCRVITTGCGKNALNTKKNIYLHGCEKSIYVYYKTKYAILIVLNFIITFLALASSLTGFLFERFVRQRYELM